MDVDEALTQWASITGNEDPADAGEVRRIVEIYGDDGLMNAERVDLAIAASALYAESTGTHFKEAAEIVAALLKMAYGAPLGHTAQSLADNIEAVFIAHAEKAADVMPALLEYTGTELEGFAKVIVDEAARFPEVIEAVLTVTMNDGDYAIDAVDVRSGGKVLYRSDLLD